MPAQCAQSKAAQLEVSPAMPERGLGGDQWGSGESACGKDMNHRKEVCFGQKIVREKCEEKGPSELDLDSSYAES